MKKLFLLTIPILLLTACGKGDGEMNCREHIDFAYITGKGQGMGYLNFPVSDSYADIKTDEFINEIKNLGCYDKVEEKYQMGVEEGKMNPDPVILRSNF